MTHTWSDPHVKWPQLESPPREISPRKITLCEMPPSEMTHMWNDPLTKSRKHVVGGELYLMDT